MAICCVPCLPCPCMLQQHQFSQPHSALPITTCISATHTAHRLMFLCTLRCQKTTQECALPSCSPEFCMHTVMLITCNTDVDLCLTHVLPCPAPVHARSSAIPWWPVLYHNTLVARALPQQHQVSGIVAWIGGMLA